MMMMMTKEEVVGALTEVALEMTTNSEEEETAWEKDHLEEETKMMTG